ncbi:MAG: DUF1127 domain-containing protein [Alphaproteobacteria bacterium]|nr:DUF1127 domain-containing protein [Alphaproteobacteria bacterium]
MLLFIVAALQRLRRWQRYRRNLTTLLRLDDRTLRDIGLARCEVHRVAWRGRRY